MSVEIGKQVELAASIVAAYISNNSVTRSDLAYLIENVYSSLTNLGVAPPDASAEPLVPAVSIKKSITQDFLICLEDGKPFRSLKRYLGRKYGLTPDQYRTKWKLPADYPMVAPAYAEQRSKLAKSIGLGRMPKALEKPMKAQRKPRMAS